MINAYAFKFIHNLNDKTKKWLDNAKKQIKSNGIDIVSNNANGDIWLKNEEVDATPIYDEKVNAQIAELEMQIAKIKEKATPLNKGEKILKQTVYVRHIENDIIAEVNELLSDDNTQQLGNAIAKALKNVRVIKTNIH